MSSKGKKKDKEDSANAATSSQDRHETDRDDTDLRPFERLMLEKLNKLDENMKELSKHVGKLTTHVLKKVDNTSVIDVLKETNNTSVSAIKELTDIMKDFTNENRTASQISSRRSKKSLRKFF